MKIKILLVDDHKIIRDGISAALNLESTFRVIGEASNGKEAVELTAQLSPDIIIMDINMPGMDGIEASHEIRKSNDKVKILILTMLEDQQYILDALTAEINGYLFKMTGLDELIKAINTISGGESYFDQKVTKMLVESISRPKPKKNDLSARELEILKNIVGGLTSKEIGEILFISPFTVQKHRKNIIKKLKLHGTAELVRYSIENNLV